MFKSTCFINQPVAIVDRLPILITNWSTFIGIDQKTKMSLNHTTSPIIGWLNQLLNIH
jgi:hypothetical protein